MSAEGEQIRRKPGERDRGPGDSRRLVAGGDILARAAETSLAGPSIRVVGGPLTRGRTLRA
jgi:hypothetical protein